MEPVDGGRTDISTLVVRSRQWAMGNGMVALDE